MRPVFFSYEFWGRSPNSGLGFSCFGGQRTRSRQIGTLRFLFHMVNGKSGDEDCLFVAEDSLDYLFKCFGVPLKEEPVFAPV